MISVRAADCASSQGGAARRTPPPLSAALPLMPAERRALDRFAALEAGGDRTAYLDAFRALAFAGPQAVYVLCEVTLRRLPLRSERSAEQLQAGAHELVRYFARLDGRQVAA